MKRLIEHTLESLRSLAGTWTGLIAGGLGISFLGFCAEHAYLSGYGINYADYVSAVDLTIDTLEAFWFVLVLALLSGALGTALAFTFAVARAAAPWIRFGLAQLSDIARGRPRRERPEALTNPKVDVSKNLVAALALATAVLGIGCTLVTRFQVSRLLITVPQDCEEQENTTLTRLACASLGPLISIGAISLPRAAGLIAPTSSVLNDLCGRTEGAGVACSPPRLLFVGRNSSHLFFLAGTGRSDSAPLILQANSVSGLSFSGHFPAHRTQQPKSEEPASNPADRGDATDALEEHVSQPVREYIDQRIASATIPFEPNIRVNSIAIPSAQIALDPRALNGLQEVLGNGMREWWTAESELHQHRLETEACLFLLNARRDLWQRALGRLPKRQEACTGRLNEVLKAIAAEPGAPSLAGATDRRASN